MRIHEFFEWLDDFDRVTDANWQRVCKILFWMFIIGVGMWCYLYMFSIFGEPQ